MRVIVINDRTDRAELAGRLFRPGADSERALESLRRLNPHVDLVDLNTIKPGTVLLVPDLPGVQREAVGDVEGDAFNAFREHALASVDAVDARVRERYKALVAQGKEVSAVLRSAAVNRALDVDLDLEPQVKAATAVSKQDQTDAKAAEQMLKALREDATTELSALLKLIG